MPEVKLSLIGNAYAQAHFAANERRDSRDEFLVNCGVGGVSTVFSTDRKSLTELRDMLSDLLGDNEKPDAGLVDEITPVFALAATIRLAFKLGLNHAEICKITGAPLGVVRDALQSVDKRSRTQKGHR